MRQLFALLVVAAMVYGIVDCAQSDDRTRRHIPLWVWVLLMIMLPLVGTIIWLVVSRLTLPGPEAQQDRPLAPDDDPEFLRSLERRSRATEEPEDTPSDADRGDAVEDEPPNETR